VRNSRIVVASFGLISSLLVIGCGSKDSSAAATCTPFDYTKYTPTSTTVSLTTDIAPIIKTSCSLTKTCHGATAVAAADHEPQLGPTSGFVGDMAGAMKVHTALVGVAAKEAPTLSYVSAGKPEDSWIMKKLEGSQTCVAGVTCVRLPDNTSPSNCGDSMPQMQDALPADQVQKVRDWIKAGAAL
jgi:hypothetical protein